jgi:hypothetical protein
MCHTLPSINLQEMQTGVHSAAIDATTILSRYIDLSQWMELHN